ncbi:MAG: glycosyltransferase family 61 protein [Actinomycetota bacterium]|nr:glycosyltransferase family 61 protein [Actinomycetota bacterium]
MSVGGKLANAVAWKALGLTARSSRPAVVHRRQVLTGRRRDELLWRTESATVIEPQYGYPIVEPRRLCLEGFDALRGALPPWSYGIPSVRKWHSPRERRARQVVELDRVVSLRHFYEWNYYHFFADVIGMLELLHRARALDDLPIVVGPSAAELRFVRELLSMGDFARMQWVVQQHDMYIRAREVTFGRSRSSHAATARFIVDRLHLTPLPPSEPGRKVFLVRRPPATRCIVNLDEVEAVTTAAGYETVDTTGWPLADQIELFRRTSCLVAIHGAGLTNMMFRIGNPMSVVELCSDRWHPESFRRAAGELGFDFTRLSCPAEPGQSPQHANFRVDVAQLAATLAAL